MRISYLVVFVLLTTGGALARAQDTGPVTQREYLSLVAPVIPGLLEEDGGGRYNQLLERAFHLARLAYSLDYRPVKRATSEYAAGRYDCLLPANPVFESGFEEHFYSVSLGVSRIYLFTAAGTQPVSALTELAGKTIGARLGMDLPASLLGQVQLESAISLERLLVMLEQGRVDAILAYTPDIYLFFEAQAMPPLPHDRSAPLLEFEDQIVCQQLTEKHPLFLRLNQALIQLSD